MTKSRQSLETITRNSWESHEKVTRKGFSLEHPQGVGIVGIVGTVGIVGIVGIEFCHPEPRPTTPSVLVDI